MQMGLRCLLVGDIQLWYVSAKSHVRTYVAVTLFSYSTVCATAFCLQVLYLLTSSAAGDLPYSELAHTVLLSSIMAGSRLQCPKGCPDEM